MAATLWPVADESTAELMIRFYRHLLDGKPTMERSVFRRDGTLMAGKRQVAAFVDDS